MRRAAWTTVLAAALVAGGVTWWLVARPDPRDGAPRGTTSEPNRLLRPLATRVDRTFAGRLRVPPATGELEGLGIAEAAAMAQLERAAEAALAQDDGDVGALRDYAQRLLWIGDWARAQAVAELVLDVAPGDGDGLALLSAVRFEQGRRTEGERLAIAALRAAPRQPLALVGRARGNAARGALDAAKADLLDAHALAPDEPLAAFVLASLLFDADRYTEAARWLAHCRRFLPDPAIGKGPFVTTGLALAAHLDGRPPCRVSPTKVQEVPMQLLPLPAVWVTLRGHGEERQGWCVLDCGASTTVLGAEAAALASRAGGSVVLSTVAGTQDTGMGVLPHLAVGDFVLEDVPVLLSGQPPIAPEVIVTLGVAAMRHCRLTLDTAARTCRFEPPDAPVAGPVPLAEIPFQLVHNQILVPARFSGGAERTFLFDTGASAVFVSPAVLGEEFGRLQGRTSTQVALGGQEVPTVEVPLPRPLVFGGRPLSVEFVVADPTVPARNRAARMENAGTIGLVIRGRHVLDFRRQRLLLAP